MKIETPPGWAETILRCTLPERDRETVSGDLLEEYRESVLPARGAGRAYRWYIRQVAGHVTRAYAWWGIVFAVSLIVRDLYDWAVPTTNFYPRSMVTTYFAMSLFFAAGFWAAWRTRSFFAALLASLAISGVAALAAAAGNGLFLAFEHNAETLNAIRMSGGIAELFVIPLMTTIPGLVLAAAGGLTSRAAARMMR